jgi:hypothetical protein
MGMVTEPSPGVDAIQESAQRRSRAPTVAIAIVAAALLGLGFWWLTGEDDSEPTEPGTVFSWNGDDLSAWVTEDEMTAALEHVSTLYAGEDLEGEAVVEHAVSDQGGIDDWVWMIGPTDDANTWKVIVHNGDHDGRYIGPPTETDPRIPFGVTFEQGSGFASGSYILSGPNSDESICITLLPPGRGLFYPDPSEVGAHEDMAFALATMMLQEMGWVS